MSLKIKPLSVFAPFLCVIIAVSPLVGYIANKNKSDNVFYLKNEFGNLSRYDMGQDHTMIVFLENTMSAIEKEHTTNTLKIVDDILISDSIVIVEEKPKNDNYVWLKTCYFSENYAGTTEKGKPCVININKKYQNAYWPSDGISVFEAIVRHEMGHVLGLKDIRDKSFEHRTQMFYDIGKIAHSYTDIDIENIRRLYC